MRISASFLFLSATILFSFFFFHAFADGIMCAENDIDSLLMFKNDLQDSGGRLSSWRGVDCCQWGGVVCDNVTAQVRELRLRNPYDYPCTNHDYELAQFEAYDNHKLVGKLNPSLLNLKSLTHLDLSCNDFQGQSFPDFISSMRNLEFLDLSTCGFNGGVPRQIANLTRLRSLSLGDHSRLLFNASLSVRDTQWLSSLYSLEQLDMSGVDFSEASDWVQVLQNLPSLLELRLSRCGLNVNPNPNPSIVSNYAVNFTHLSLLDLSWNNFDSSVPQWIYSLTNLVHLNLSHCGLHPQIPPALQNLTKLEHLNLSSNNFTSTFPTWFTRLSHLKVLAVADNLIQGELPSAVGDMTSLVSLDLSQNRMEGMLPQSLSNLCNLEEMYLYINRFSGTLPNLSGCISNSLRLLYLGSNKFSGSLPSDLKNLARLREFDVSDNKLTGPLPTSLEQLHELEYLVISDNTLEGIVSESQFRNLSRLKIFRANGNRFTFKPSRDWVPPFQLQGLTLRSWRLGPEFPPWIQHLKQLQYLSLANTGIDDAFPPWFWSLTSQFKYLNLSSNMIRGHIPSLLDIGMSRNVAIDMKRNLITGPLPLISSNVTILDLSSNLISGSMDNFLCREPDLQNMRLEILDLGNNSLSGEIPDCWQNWQSLRVVRLQTNNLTGEIPASIGHLMRLHSLHLRKNNLSGEVPASLQNCSGLVVLDLGLNHFKGLLPLWIHRLSELVVFNLRHNEFSGKIPVELCNLTSVQALDLAGNNLSGRIPSCFDSFNVMTGRQKPSDRLYYSAEDTFGGVPDSQFLFMKGRFGLYSNILHWVMTLDVSDNALTGTIPREIMLLHKLQALNLSRNSLTGRIPERIGDMSSLEALDISSNKLSGEIPQSISELTFLSNLNLSYNELTGRIPSGTQLQGFDEWSFIGNKLCGPPVSEKCDVEGTAGGDGEDEEERKRWIFGGKGWGFFVSIVLGYVVGFWTVIATFVLNMSWRDAYFGLFARIGSSFYHVWLKCLRRCFNTW